MESQFSSMIVIPDNVHGLIFDCDGTLADTMPSHQEAWKQAFEVRGRSFPLEFWKRFHGVPSEVIVEAYNREFEDDIDPQDFSVDKQRRVAPLLRHAVPIRAVTELVDRYRNALPMAVASGGTRHNVDLILEAIGLTDAFPVILTADDSFAPKPEPGLFWEAAARLGVSPTRCHVLEDGDPGFEAARRAGMTWTDVRPYANMGGR